MIDLIVIVWIKMEIKIMIWEEFYKNYIDNSGQDEKKW